MLVRYDTRSAIRRKTAEQYIVDEVYELVWGRRQHIDKAELGTKEAGIVTPIMLTTKIPEPERHWSRERSRSVRGQLNVRHHVMSTEERLRSTAWLIGSAVD